jgi:cell fate (sporulation/competence/biofilm development) regulator YmcA (YheA/YmcA/DUF963 family)
VGTDVPNGGASNGRIDPSKLTTDALNREITHVVDLFNIRLQGMTETRDEKFATVKQQFDLVERQRVEQKSDTKTAVDAALAAQKEAVREQTIASERAIAKSEAGTSEQLKQLGANFNTSLEGSRESIGDLKERLGRIEAVKGNNQWLIGVGAILIGALAGIIGHFL